MSKEKNKDNKKDILKKLNIKQASSDSSVYKNSATIILRGKPITAQNKKESKFLEFLSRAPISFDYGEEE
tara:strand:- start:287 stop:496 length:210 start_codon:yes stop_codon:yes gene_type:complete